MPSATATTAYPGYARARKKLENNARRAGKPGTAPIMRAFSFLVRVVLAAVLLPLDLLMGDAVRTGDMTRPFTGAFGIAVAYGAFRAAEFAVGLGRASSNADHDETKRALFRFRVPPPATLDPCRLQGVPLLSKSSVCAYKGTVVNVVVEPFEITNRYDDKKKLSVDVVATSEVSVSLTLDPSKLWSRDLQQAELEKLVEDFEKEGIAHVDVSSGYSIISLIGNVERNNEIMERSFHALRAADIKVSMVSQGASKTNISLLVNRTQGDEAVRAIHAEFFEFE